MKSQQVRSREDRKLVSRQVGKKGRQCRLLAIFCRALLVKADDSQAYRKLDVTRECIKPSVMSSTLEKKYSCKVKLVAVL